MFIRIRNQSMDRKMETLNWKEWRIRGIWWPANSVDRYSSASLTTDVYGGFRCLEERSVDGRWMENHTRCRSVHRMCWSCMLFVMIVIIWTCTDRRMWCWSSRSLYRQKWKCWTMQFSCRMELHHLSFDERRPGCVPHQWTLGRWEEVHPEFRSSIVCIDWIGWLDTLVIYRSMKMETYSSLTTITTELFCCILDGLMFKYSWTEINIRSNHQETLLYTREATVDRRSTEIRRVNRWCPCVQSLFTHAIHWPSNIQEWTGPHQVWFIRSCWVEDMRQFGPLTSYARYDVAH